MKKFFTKALVAVSVAGVFCAIGAVGGIECGTMSLVVGAVCAVAALAVSAVSFFGAIAVDEME